MTTLAAVGIVFFLRWKTVYSSVNFMPVYGLAYCWNSVSACRPQVVAVHQKENAFRPCELDEAVREGDGGERLAGAGGHLDEGAGPIVSEGQFQVADGLDLDTPEPRLVQRRQLPEPVADLFIQSDQSEKFFGTVEGEDIAAAGVLFQTVRELRDGAGGFIGERQRQLVSRKVVRETVGVLARLRLDAGQREIFRFGLDNADGLALDVEHVVGDAGLQRKFTHGHSAAGGDVHVGVVLHEPAAQRQLLVNLLTCFLFGRHGRRSPRRCLNIIRAENAEVQRRSNEK
jgi:hypothetical protein